MTLRMLSAVIYLALTLAVSGLQNGGTKTVSISSQGGLKPNRHHSGGRKSRKVVRKHHRRVHSPSLDETTSRANCVAWKDSSYANYPADALYQYSDFTSRSEADAFFKSKKDFGQLATIQYADGVQADTYGSYYTHDGNKMALVCGISLNGTTPWSTKAVCDSGEVVDSMEECQLGGPFLGLKYKGYVSTDDGNTPPGCHSVSGESFYNTLTSISFTGGASASICRVTTTTTTPLPSTLYAGHLNKLVSFTSTQYDGFTGSVSLETTAHGIGTKIKMSGRHNPSTRAALRSRSFKAHLHALPCASDGGGHFQDANGDGTANGVNENWPELTCDDNGDCFGKAHNAWAPTVAQLTAGMSIVVHDTPNGGSKAFCADLTQCPSTDVNACLTTTAPQPTGSLVDVPTPVVRRSSLPDDAQAGPAFFHGRRQALPKRMEPEPMGARMQAPLTLPKHKEPEPAEERDPEADHAANSMKILQMLQEMKMQMELKQMKDKLEKKMKAQTTTAAEVLKVETTTSAPVLKVVSTTAAEVLKVETAATTTVLAALKEDPCNDSNEFCGDWATKGECGNNPGYMNIVCKSACKQCKGAPQQPVLAQTK